eukprot:3262216-Amphidinium_carterae.2
MSAHAIESSGHGKKRSPQRSRFVGETKSFQEHSVTMHENTSMLNVSSKHHTHFKYNLSPAAHKMLQTMLQCCRRFDGHAQASLLMYRDKAGTTMKTMLPIVLTMSHFPNSFTSVRMRGQQQHDRACADGTHYIAMSTRAFHKVAIRLIACRQSLLIAW